MGLHHPDPAIGADATERGRHVLAELIRRTYRYAHVDGALAAADAALAAGWRPPAPMLTTQAELAACAAGTVVTDRDGHPWVLDPAGQWCEPLPTGVYPDELVQWAPLIRHLDGPGRRADP